MSDNFEGTRLEKGRGDAEFSEVEELIRQTLEETKKQSPSSENREVKVEPPKEEYKATAFTPEPITPPPPIRSATPAPVKKTDVPTTPTPVASAYDKTFKEYKIGDIVKGKVLKLDSSGVLVDIKYKADGFIPAEDLTDRSGSRLKVGDEIDVLIENLENKEGYVVLSKRHADHEKRWSLANNAFRNKSILQGKVIQVLRGGLVVDCDGLRGFVPASQVSKRPEETLESFQGKDLTVKVIELNQRQGKIVMSHKLAAGEKSKVDNQKLYDELEAGQVRKGKVVSIKNFGAFVDLGGVEGLIHLTELSWKRVKHPSEVVKIGEELEVFVLSVDKINRKIALGLKELQPDPWASAAELYKPGQVVKVKVLRLAKFGAFVELEHGLEGLIHNSELAWEPIQEPGQVVKIGDQLEVKVLRVIPEEQKIGLSLKALLPVPERKSLPEEPPVELPEEKKVTIGDMIAEKERARAEKEEEQSETELETEAEIPADQPPAA